MESTGFYRDQIEIKKDDKTRTIQIQGQRPLSTQTKARFNEAYRVPESCDMTKLNTSFSHGLLTFEFPKVVEGEKPEKAVQNQGKIVHRPNQDESGGSGPNGSSLGRKKPSDEEKKVGTSQEKVASTANKEEPKTYKSVLEGKRPVVPTGSREKFEQKMKEGEASPSLGRKELEKEEKVVERKEAAQIGQQKTVQKLKEEEAKSTPTIGGSLKPKVLAKEEKLTQRKKDGDIGQNKTGQKVKEISGTPIINGGLKSKVHAKVERVNERKGDGEMGQKLKEEGKIGLGQKKDENHTKPVVGNEARKTDKEIAAMNQAKTELKTKERVESIAQEVNGNVESKHDKNDEKTVGDKVSEGEIQETVKQKKVEEAGLVKETGDVKDNAEVAEPEKVDDPVKEESTQVGEDREKMVEKSLESETGPLLVEERQKKTDMDPPAVGGRGMDQEESQKYDIPLVNVGVAALVIMGFGAYVFVPLVKLFY